MIILDQKLHVFYYNRHKIDIKFRLNVFAKKADIEVMNCLDGAVVAYGTVVLEVSDSITGSKQMFV